MAQQDLKLLGSALALRRFTSEELGRAAHANPHTARSWISRNKALFRTEQAKANGARGRPRQIWILTADSATELRRRIDVLDLSLLGREAINERSVDLGKIESQWETWKLARRLSSPTEAAELASVRRSVRLAWEDFSAFFLLTSEVPSGMRTLAELEREVGGGDIPPSDDLKEVARWLGDSLLRMNRQGGPDPFASRVLWLRSEIRTRPEQVKVTAAALAAPVWSDEGLASSPEHEDALSRCGKVADFAPVSAVISHVSDAIGGGRRSYCDNALEAQATLRGLTARTRLRTSSEAVTWLGSLKMTRFWRPELAPVTFHGVLEAPDIHFGHLMNLMRTELTSAVQQKYPRVGKLRREPLEYCRYALSQPLADRRTLCDDNVSDILSIYSSRPNAKASNS